MRPPGPSISEVFNLGPAEKLKLVGALWDDIAADRQTDAVDSTSPTVFDLSVPDKLQLVHDLWDSVAADPENIPVRADHLAEVERRAAKLRANPETALSWEDVKRAICERHAHGKHGDAAATGDGAGA